MQDYGTYRMSGRETLKYIPMYLLLDGMISYLFFRSWVAWIVLLPGSVIFLKRGRERLAKQRLLMMQTQFLTGMQLVCTSLQAGYAVENAFREALKELRKIYPEQSFIVKEFGFITGQNELNRSIESLLMDLGKRSHAEDIRNFAEVFCTAKRTGGDLITVIRNTVSCIQQKQETRMEIETNLAGKIMEQNMMSMIPVGILGYVNMTSPDFLEVMYCEPMGQSVMGFCLAVYLTAYLWGKKIMEIPV